MDIWGKINFTSYNLLIHFLGSFTGVGVENASGGGVKIGCNLQNKEGGYKLVLLLEHQHVIVLRSSGKKTHCFAPFESKLHLKH